MDLPWMWAKAAEGAGKEIESRTRFKLLPVLVDLLEYSLALTWRGYISSSVDPANDHHRALGCNNQNDAAILRDYLINFATSPGQLTLPPRTGSYLQRAVVSTFAGEWCTFGRGSVRDGWASVLADPSVVAALQTMGREVAFIPSWFQRIEQRKQEFGSLVNGDFHVSLTSPNGGYSKYTIVERWMASWWWWYHLGYRCVSSTIQPRSTLYGSCFSLVLHCALLSFCSKD